MVKVDVLIIGAGTAGEYAAGYANQGGRSVAVIEKGPVGGECIFHACIPTKALVHAARARKRSKRVGFFGLEAADPPVDYARVKAHKDAVIAGIGTGRDQRMVNAGIGVFRGEAQFVSVVPVPLDDVGLVAGHRVEVFGTALGHARQDVGVLGDVPPQFLYVGTNHLSCVVNPEQYLAAA